MAPYIFMERNGIHIIDLYKTVAKVDEAAEALTRQPDKTAPAVGKSRGFAHRMQNREFPCLSIYSSKISIFGTPNDFVPQ